MAIFYSYIIYKHNTDKPISRKLYVKEVVMALLKNTDREPNQHIRAAEEEHKLSNLPSRQARISPVRGKRSS